MLKRFVSWFKWIGAGLVALLLALVMADFISSNTLLVDLNLVGFSFPGLSLPWLMIVSFVVGGILGLLSALMIIILAKHKIHRLEKKLKSRDEELQKIRTSTL
ncbi:LapA family protein [Zooshikella sp. RANM57]|uniref:LapA family protein n=1 Tax=Zooshikella sp. RANM57 TaxID=3425863 RepID=UPI003D7000FF